MPSTVYNRTAAVAIAIGVAIVIAPHDDGGASSSWEVTNLATQQQISQKADPAQSRRAAGTRRTGQPAERTGRRIGQRHSWWPQGYCQAIRHHRWLVRGGDTLDLVARCTGSTVADLRAVNGISGGRLSPGRTLVIPD